MHCINLHFTYLLTYRSNTEQNNVARRRLVSDVGVKRDLHTTQRMQRTQRNVRSWRSWRNDRFYPCVLAVASPAFVAFVTYFLAFAAYVVCVTLDENHA